MKKLFLLPAFLIFLSCTSAQQQHDTITHDTLTVTFFVKDTTIAINEEYYLMDAYGDTITSNTSKDWIQTLPGYIIDDEYLNIFYKPIDPKFKILNLEPRTVRKKNY